MQRLNGQNETIEFVWVPSHVGICGNEKVDKIANLASQNPDKISIKEIQYCDHKLKKQKVIEEIW